MSYGLIELTLDGTKYHINYNDSAGKNLTAKLAGISAKQDVKLFFIQDDVVWGIDKKFVKFLIRISSPKHIQNILDGIYQSCVSYEYLSVQLENCYFNYPEAYAAEVVTVVIIPIQYNKNELKFFVIAGETFIKPEGE